MVSQPRWGNGSKGRLLSISGAGFCAIETDWQNQFDGLRLLGQDYRRGGCRGEAFEHFNPRRDLRHQCCGPRRA